MSVLDPKYRKITNSKDSENEADNCARPDRPVKGDDADTRSKPQDYRKHCVEPIDLHVSPQVVGLGGTIRTCDFRVPGAVDLPDFPAPS